MASITHDGNECFSIEEQKKELIFSLGMRIHWNYFIRTVMNDTNDNHFATAIVELTNATTVHLPMERNRIESCNDSRIDTNGNVFYGPIGIAMTRSFGNSVMLRAGIIPISIITKQNLGQLSSNTLNGNSIDDMCRCGWYI